VESIVVFENPRVFLSSWNKARRVWCRLLHDNSSHGDGDPIQLEDQELDRHFGDDLHLLLDELVDVEQHCLQVVLELQLLHLDVLVAQLLLLDDDVLVASGNEDVRGPTGLVQMLLLGEDEQHCLQVVLELQLLHLDVLVAQLLLLDDDVLEASGNEDVRGPTGLVQMLLLDEDVLGPTGLVQLLLLDLHDVLPARDSDENRSQWKFDLDLHLYANISKICLK
jgi:hypothetical protein